MATQAMTAPKRGFRHVWLPLLAAIALVAVIGVAFAAGRRSASDPTPAKAATQSALGSQLTGMVPWMRSHTDDITWMQTHMGDVTWMRGHGNQWQWMQDHRGDIRWMQTHPTQWQWTQTHMRDIGWMHDHWGQWKGWRSSMDHGTHSGSNGGWNCGQWC